MIFDVKDKCRCSINTPIIKEIKGRSLDFLYTADGAKINGGNVANLFKNIPNSLVRAQMIQNKMDEIKVLLEIDKRLYKKEYDNILRNEFLHKFGNKTRVVIKHVEKIPRERSGKYSMIKNNANF